MTSKELQSEFKMLQEEVGRLNEILRKIAIIVFQKGGGRQGKVEKIRHLIYDWREK